MLATEGLFGERATRVRALGDLGSSARFSEAKWLARDELGRLTAMGHSPNGHLEAASRHETAAGSHERSAKFWDTHGDTERAALQRELADHERRGAELERRWAALIERETAAAD